jgi:hypothetical protein
MVNIKMKKKNIISMIISLLYLSNSLFSQSDSPEVFIIDAFVTPETPHIFKLSYFTSEEVKAKIIIDEKYTFSVSEEFVEDHSTEIDFTKYKFAEKFVPYQILSERKNGEQFESEIFELVLPYDEFIETKEGENPVSTILLGMFFYLLPSPNVLMTENDNYFSLTKELPIVTFYSSGYNYPSGNISLEYTHVYENSISNFFRLGYKHFIPIDVFEYVSPGLTGFTDFNGFNGIGAEVSLGLFKFYDVFTVFSKYRYNINPSETNQYFHEISIGLYSHFFTIDL